MPVEYPETEEFVDHPEDSGKTAKMKRPNRRDVESFTSSTATRRFSDAPLQNRSLITHRFASVQSSITNSSVNSNGLHEPEGFNLNRRMRSPIQDPDFRRRGLQSRFTSIRKLSFYNKVFKAETGGAKPRILALHGKMSNNAVTKLQLENLRITRDKYDIVTLNGPIKEEHGDPEVEVFVKGPFYSWFHGNYTDGRFKPSLLQAISYVWKAIEKLGPFDAVYGFSQGATVATMVASSYLDIEVRHAVMAADTGYAEISSEKLIYDGAANAGSKLNVKLFLPGSNDKRIYFKTHEKMAEDAFDELPFEYMVLACAVDVPDAVRHALGLSDSCLEASSINLPSIHLIGIGDPRKDHSEEMATLFTNAQVKYMLGGHSVTRFLEQDQDLLRSLHENLVARDNVVTMTPPDMKKVSEMSSVGVMSNMQMASVLINNDSSGYTVIEALSKRIPDKALFFNARDSDPSNFTTYSDVLNFIVEGPGDLRRLGIKTGEIVAYGAPPGGGAVPALALLSIISQTAAAPLAPSTTESDALYLLDQFNAKHLILFSGVDCPGLESAFERYAASGKAILHRATIRAGDKPGFFDYTRSGMQDLDPNWAPSASPLQNPTDSIALLLGTSGTTSKPKGVPIMHGALVQNGHLLASSIGLSETDVCYSIMPLFHIGGISASILSTIVSGGSICCDPEPYNPEKMVDALALSNPQPTWYSSVPTIHNGTVSFIKDMAGASEKLKSYGINKDGIWKTGHSLRLIRSGAAALLGSDALNLSATYGNVPVYPTYSMSEQMPISQPPYGKTNMITDKPGSVGVPVAASLAIVNSSTMKVMPHGQEGEIAISGPTVMKNYLNNQEANKKSYFHLTLPLDPRSPFQHSKFFLTGDIGLIDEEGFLTLKGRSKELIKKGGEQISPFEIEEPIITNPWVEIAVCFAVPSKLYGEEVGLAIVLSSSAPTGVDTKKVSQVLRGFLKTKNINPAKWPTIWKIVENDDLPKTKSNKYIRVGLSKTLGLEGDNEDDISTSNLKSASENNNTFIDWDVISSFRFFLACYVMFMHIGSNKSWAAFNNLRGWPWHVHVFYTLGGFSLAAPMNPPIKKKMKYFFARIGAMYPMYVVALIFALINLLIACRPSTFSPEFHWDSKPDDLYIDGKMENGTGPLFCEGTPATPNSYWASLFLTIIVYFFGFLVTPFWSITWWMGYYLWFSAMYYQCLMVFPSLYNALLKFRGNAHKFVSLVLFLLVANNILLLSTWFSLKDAEGYNHYDPETGEMNSVDDYNRDAYFHNAIVLGWYLFSPFWILYFILGACIAFLYDAYRPTEMSTAYIWGYIADGCTLLILAWSIVTISQGNVTYNFERVWYLHPSEADNYTDTSSTVRLWNNIYGRLFAPLTSLWIFSLSTGEGWTAEFFRVPFLAKIIAPNAYNCFLFHQPVSQWYYAATRNGEWWNWWQYRKGMYWFSPQPCPVEWYEYGYLVILTCAFSVLMNQTAQPIIRFIIEMMKILIFGESESNIIDTEEKLIGIIEDMTGFAPQLDWSLDQCGLSSVGLPPLAARLKKAFSSSTNPVSISPSQLSDARTVSDILKAVESAITQAKADGI